jgi:hypothetical protein
LSRPRRNSSYSKPFRLDSAHHAWVRQYGLVAAAPSAAALAALPESSLRIARPSSVNHRSAPLASLSSTRAGMPIRCAVSITYLSLRAPARRLSDASRQRSSSSPTARTGPGMPAFEAQVPGLYQQMVRITIEPRWAKLLDFETRLPTPVENLIKSSPSDWAPRRAAHCWILSLSSTAKRRTSEQFDMCRSLARAAGWSDCARITPLCSNIRLTERPPSIGARICRLPGEPVSEFGDVNERERGRRSACPRCKRLEVRETMRPPLGRWIASALARHDADLLHIVKDGAGSTERADARKFAAGLYPCRFCPRATRQRISVSGWVGRE